MYGDGYQEFVDYNAVDAVPNPGYRNSAGLPFEWQAHVIQNSNIDLIMQRMADMMQNQFGLKPKNQSYAYKSSYPEWYNRVALPLWVKPPTDLTKFSGQDDTSTIKHISRYLMQLGEASTDEALRIRYFLLSLIGPAFTWVYIFIGKLH